MSISLKFYLDWQEYFAAQEFFRGTRQAISPEKVIGGVLITLSALWFFLDDLNLFAVIGLIAGLAIIFITPSVRRLVSKSKWEREPLYHTEHTVLAGEEGVYIQMGHVESNLDWKYYQRLIESPEGFLLIYGDDSFNLFPKRAFPNEQMVHEFRNLAGNNLKK